MVMQASGLQVPNKNFFCKTNDAVKSSVRKTSWNRGWLRILIEGVFCMIVVVSFILIVMTAISSPVIPEGSRCSLSGCRVICVDAPYYDAFEADIIFAVSAAEGLCERVFLTLRAPRFHNDTLPTYWLSGMRTDLEELEIIGGNLRFIESEAFMTSFSGSIYFLHLDGIVIARWQSNMLAGLSSLKRLVIERSLIGPVENNALVPVDDTLNSLSIIRCGLWHPRNLTGTANFEQLEEVVLSGNNFRNTLSNDSFSRMKSCKSLYLNSCRITIIPEHTFDELIGLEILFLNNNNLVTLPVGLFDLFTAMQPKPRMHLEDNYLFCDCEQFELRRLSDSGMLVVDPVCIYPDHKRGKSVSSLEVTCNRQNYHIYDGDKDKKKIIDTIYTNGSCHDTDISNTSRRLISPSSAFVCGDNILAFSGRLDDDFLVLDQTPPNNDWIAPSFAMKRDNFSMVEITSNDNLQISGYGLLWYQSNCPHEVFCLNAMPNLLRVYNIDMQATYTFCPVVMSSGMIQNDKCINYSIILEYMIDARLVIKYAIFVSIILGSVLLGAILVYGLIRRYPWLLRGSKRIMFVKHKTVDALILPPKVPLRPDLLEDKPVAEFNDNIFLLPDCKSDMPSNFRSTKSVRSSKSETPSYISALEPTEAQLTEWRLRHLDHVSTVSSISLDVSAYSWATDSSDSYYTLSEESNPPYHSFH